MNCLQAQDLLLEADRDDLLGRSMTELGQHVATCATCGALARRILEAEVALDQALAQPRERRPAVRIVTPAAPRWTRLATWTSLAAAAALVMWMLPRQQPPAAPARPAAPRASVDVDVTSSAGQTAVVFRTADPGITVVWFIQN